jgi:hypothetical protein
MSLTQLGGEYNNAPYIYKEISKYIIKELNIKEEIKQLLQEKIRPIKDHLAILINNRKTYWRQDAAKFSNVIKEKLFAVPPNEYYKKYPSITSGRLLELLTRVDNKDFNVSDSTYDGFVVTREGDKLEYNTGIDIDEFIKTKRQWTTEQDSGNFIFGSLSTEKAETERRRQIIEEINNKKTKNNVFIINKIFNAYIAEITKIIEAKIKNITVPTDISENDAHKPAEPLSAANGAVIEEKKPTTGGQRRNRKSKKARKTKKDRKSRKNRRKSNRRRR